MILQITRTNFICIQLNTIHECIDWLNSRVNANINKANNWQKSVSNLCKYLNSNNFNHNVINRESIDNYIDVNIHVNELFDTFRDEELFDNIKQFREE